MNEYDSIINDYVEAPASQAATSINDNPDQAVRARQLSRATNQPVLAVYNDLDNAEQEHRAALTRNIVSGNDKLAAYIRGNELADVVSNDDYGNLDNIGRAAKNVLDHGSDTGLKSWVPGPRDVFGPAIDATRNYISTALREGAKGAFQSLIEGFGYDFNKGDFNFYMDEALNKYSPGFTERNPYSAEAYRALELVPRAIVGTTMSPINAAAGFLGGAGTSMASQLGADSSANQLKRELPEVVMQGIMGQSAPHVAEGAGNIIRAVEAIKAAKPWLDAGVDVPRGVHPLIDQIKEKTNDARVDKIQIALQAAQTSFTKERDPELFKSYMKEYFADAQMGISADAVVRLYGDKLPSREDGILGWIPGIEDKLEAAKTFGEDVHVPLADWVTYVDPQLASELKPDLRAWPGGITKNEAAIKDIAAPAIDGALPQVRTSAALEPMFAIGDRPLKLEKGESIWKGMEDYNFVDHTGKVVGDVTIFPDPMKKQLYIASVASHDLQPNTMGPSLIRDILRQLKELYPEYETISGYRISGAREEAGAPKEQRKPVVKLALGDKFTLRRVEDKTSYKGRDPEELAYNDGYGWDHLTDQQREYYNNLSSGGPSKDGVFEFVDSKGNVAGQATLTFNNETKDIFVHWIGSSDHRGANDFGPRTILELKRQLKEMYPEYKTISGDRISGAREEAGVTGTETYTSVKLALGDAFELSQEYTDLRRILETAPTKFGDVTADLVPKELWTKNEHAINQAMQEEVNRIAGKTVEPILAGDIRYEGIDGIRGVYHQAPGEVAKILVAALDPDKIGILRHELIHHLYRNGFFKPEEWNALIEASKKEGWIDRYGIADRYGHLNELGQHEEAIAEAFRDWAKTREQQPVTPVTTIFQKLWDLMQRIKDRVAKILGREPKFDELFEAAYSGELAQREAGAKTSGDMFSKGELETQLKAEAAGLDAKHKKKIDKLINQEYKENLEAAMKRAEAEQKTLQSKEWKEAAKEIRKEVEADIKQRPDVAADLLIGSGELGGKQLERKNYPLRADDLTDAQKASLPRRYYSKDGVPVDMMANLFGFTSGDRLVEDLSAYTKSREGMSAQEGLRKTIDEEVQRRMEEKFGKLQDNIMLEAMDQAFSETALNRLAEEWQGAAMQAGIQVIDKNVAKEEALRIFNKRTLKEINPEHLIGIMGKLGRDAERAAIDQRWNDMSVLMQRKYMTGLIVAEARKVQKEMQAAERTFKQFAKREVKSMEPEYTDQVHDIMQRIGKTVQRSIQDLQESFAREGYKNLADFVDQKQQALRVVDAWEPLLSGDWRKDYNSLTVEEFRGVHGTIKNLVHNGKEERKIYRAGEAAEFAELLPQFIGSIKDAAHDKFAKLGKGKYEKLPEQYFVQHIQMETFLNRLDGYDPDGVWFQYVYRNLADGSSLADKWRKHFVNRLKEVEQPENLHRTLDNPLFKDQDTNAPLKFTRRNLIAVMLNTGNSTNLKKMAEGYKLKSDDIMAWVHQYATKKEWDYVQHVWDVFKEIKDQSDTMYRSLSGVAPENIEIRPIDTPHGQYKGGYYPLIRDPNQVGQGSGKVFGKDALTQENFVSAMPAAGYTKKRTGAIYPIALEPDMMNAQMSQMIHDISMRPAIINASKVFMNKEVQSAIRAHFGDAWRHELKDYLVGVANSQNYMPQNQRAIVELAEFVRQNVISTVVGFNPGTVMKHGPTALFLSTKEVGLKNFAKAAWEANIFRNILAEVAPESYRGAVRTLLGINDATSNKAWNFIRENSLEIARRDRNWEETLFGASAGLQPFDQYATWRAKIMQWSSKPVALSDMLSAVPTWLAAYKEAVAAGKDHGEAVSRGDRAVRRAHGSTASTSRTAFQRNYNPYLTSIYNFWSDILNRQVETIWKAGDEAHLTNGNPVSKGLATVPILAGGLFAYSIMPSIIEAYVSPHPHKDDEGFVWKSVKQLMFTQLGGWVGLRDAATAFAFARDPHYGLTGTAWQGLTNLPRDLMKGQPLAKERVGRLIQDGAGLIGTLTGSFPLQIGKSARYLYGVHSGQENPRNTWQWLVGLRFGTNDKHSRSFEEYMKGH